MQSSSRKTVGIWIPGSPVGKARARVALRYGKAHAYTPASTRAWEQAARIILDAELRSHDAWDGPVRLELHCVMPRPKSCQRRRHPAVKPDIDNIVKSVCDVLNTRLFRDDAQVIELVVKKEYESDSQKPGIAISACEILSNTQNEGKRRGIICG